MSKPKQPQHLHNYKRIDISAGGERKKPYLVFKCMKPTCGHYIAVRLAENKLCECSVCHEPMIINKESIHHAKPHCSSCIKRRSKGTEDVTAIADFLNKTGI